MDDPRRGTGRTTRALASCLLYAAQHPHTPTYYVVHATPMVSYVKDLAHGLCEGKVPANFRATTTRSIQRSQGLRGVYYTDHFQGGGC